MFQHCFPRFKILPTLITDLRKCILAVPVAPVSVKARFPHLFPAVFTLDQLVPSVIMQGFVVFHQVSLSGEGLVTEMAGERFVFEMNHGNMRAQRVLGLQYLPAVRTEVSLAAGTVLVLPRHLPRLPLDLILTQLALTEVLWLGPPTQELLVLR